MITLSLVPRLIPPEPRNEAPPKSLDKRLLPLRAWVWGSSPHERRYETPPLPAWVWGSSPHKCRYETPPLPAWVWGSSPHKCRHETPPLPAWLWGSYEPGYETPPPRSMGMRLPISLCMRLGTAIANLWKTQVQAGAYALAAG